MTMLGDAHNAMTGLFKGSKSKCSSSSSSNSSNSNSSSNFSFSKQAHLFQKKVGTGTADHLHATLTGNGTHARTHNHKQCHVQAEHKKSLLRRGGDKSMKGEEAEVDPLHSQYQSSLFWPLQRGNAGATSTTSSAPAAQSPQPHWLPVGTADGCSVQAAVHGEVSAHCEGHHRPRRSISAGVVATCISPFLDDQGMREHKQFKHKQFKPANNHSVLFNVDAEGLTDGAAGGSGAASVVSCMEPDNSMSFSCTPGSPSHNTGHSLVSAP